MSVTTHLSGGFKDWSKPTYDEIHMATKHIADFIHYNTTQINKIDLIVAIKRGGYIMGLQLSHMLNLPLESVSYSSKEGQGDNKNHANECLPQFKHKNILLVDEICDSGKTLAELKDIYTTMGYNVSTAVLYFKDHGHANVHEPDIWAVKISNNFGWVYYPWES